MERYEPVTNRQDPLPSLTADVKARKSEATSPMSSSGLQDKFFSAVFQQIFPEDGANPGKPNVRSSKYGQPPGFSLPLMSTNFRRFNARIGVVFVFQSRLIKLLSWKVPTQTCSFLAVYSFCCLDPNLLAVLPLAACVLFVMVPAFIARHPPPPIPTEAYDGQGRASGPAPNIKPAPEMSNDFFRNLRDLQNVMEDFSVAHDRLLGLIVPVTNFSDEKLSSSILILLFSLSCLLFIAAALLPWRLVFLLTGWTAICSLHPLAIRIISEIDKGPIRQQVKRVHRRFYQWVNEDIVLDETPERKDVEIFELQRRTDGEWEPWVYAISPYTPRSPLRLSGDRPRGTQYFEDVAPPKGWEWSGKKWTIDLLSREWVEERMITAVQIEMEGERWVYDSLEDEHKDASRVRRKPKQGDWEEGSGLEAQGNWRRRRWIRQVQRKITKPDSVPP